MRRLLATLFTSGMVVILAGCGKSYETRLNASLDRMRYLQRLDQNLQAPIADQFEQAGIYLRPPKPLTRAQQPVLTVDQSQFDLIASFLDVSGGTNKKGGQADVLRLHVLARVKAAQAANKKKEAPPEVERLPFQAAVVDLLARDLGELDPDTAVQLMKTDKMRLNEYKRLIFNADNGNVVRTYFYSQPNYDIALIWDIPKPLENSPPVSSGLPLTLESLVVGPRASAAFQGIDVQEEGYIEPGKGGEAETPGLVF